MTDGLIKEDNASEVSKAAPGTAEGYFDPAIAVAALDAERAREEKKQKRKTLVQAIKYACCTASAGVIEIVSYTVLYEVLPIDKAVMIDFITHVELRNFVSTLIALTLSILWNFTINRKFTFKSAGNVGRAMFLAFLFYVPFFPFKLWFNGYMPSYLAAGAASAAGVTVVEYLKKHVIINYAVEVCTMLINGVLEFCWQKFVIYRKEEGSALAKYEEGTVGEFGEIGIKDRGYDGADLLELMRDGEDISEMTDKDIRKAVEARAAADRKATVVR